MRATQLIRPSLVGILLIVGMLLWSCSSAGGGSTDATDGDGSQQSGNFFYIDPVNGDPANDGSAEHPWRTLQEVLTAGLIETRAYTDLPYTGDNPLETKNPGAPVTAGDTLVLLSGYHGIVDLMNVHNESTITIQAAEGQTPTLSSINLTSASNWRFKGLTVSPSAAPTYENKTLFSAVSHSWQGPSDHISIEDCRLYSVEDSSSWSADDWNDLAANAISMNGDYMTARGNLCRNVNFGITISGNNGTVVANTIENFAGDGMRGLGNDLLFESNLVENCYAVNANHDDGFQSWSINDDPPRERVTLRGNTIINFVGADYPLRGSLQGIGCFDGPYIDWVVENNLVITDHWHGISLYGAVDSRIVNNTVVDADDDPESPGPPWIMFHDHKDTTPSSGCLIRNNIAASISTSGDTVADHNYLLQEGDTIFEDPANDDYHLRADATNVIDAGSSDQAPTTDKDGTSRPRGSGIDPGCYEY
jgi:hypothetical protein